MGFMAGLGKGFSNSFAQAAQNRAAREQDAFRVAYDEYQRKREEFDKQEQAWNSALKKGEAIAQKYGQPPEASLKAAEWLMSGFSDSYVDDMLANAKFSSTPDVTQASDANNVDQQMANSGLDPNVPTPEAAGADPTMAAPIPDPNNNQPVTNQNTDLLGGLLGPDGIFKNAGKSDMEQAQSQVMEAGGIDQAQWDTINKGFQPPDTSGITFESTRPTSANNPLTEFGLADGITKAKFNAADVAAKQWAKSTNPEDIAKAQRWEAIKPDLELALREDIDPATKAEMMKPLEATQKIRIELGNQRAAAKTMLDQGKVLADMAMETEAVLSSTAGAVSGFESLKKEVGTVFNILGQLPETKDMDEQTLLGKALEELNKNLGGESVTPELAQKYREFTAASIRYIFAVGRALGTEGNGFSNKDYENIRNAILTSNDGPAFVNNLKRMALEQFGAVDNQLGELNSMPEIQILMNDEFLGPLLKQQLLGSDEKFAKDKNYQWMKSPMTKAGDPLADLEPKTTKEERDANTPQKVEQQTTGGTPVGDTITVTGDGVYKKIKAGPDEDFSTWEKVN